jgi:hypothetical protein
MRTFYGASKADRLQARAAFVPKGSRLVPGPSGGAVYIYETASKFYAVAFWGSSVRSLWHYSYRTTEQREKAVVEFHHSLTATATRKQSAKREKDAWTNPAKVGDILYTSWGYDQTNVEFYAVTRVSGTRVWVREIAQDSESTGYMQEKCWPAMPIRYCGDETMHTARMAGAQGYSIKINGSATAWPETGRDHYSSSYA